MLGLKNEIKLVRHREGRNWACAEGLWPQEAECVEGIRKMRADGRRGKCSHKERVDSHVKNYYVYF